MAEEDRGLPGLLPGLQGAEAGALQLRIHNSICKSVQSKVENMLQDVEKFSDIEKLYLYLQLPAGPGCSSEKTDQSALSSSRTQQMHAFSWICSHLEEFPETSLPKQEVYDEYKSFCDNLNYQPLSAADFGKMMKNVFPNMKARRLGMRGKSKYCYSGLRKRPFVHFPSLPNLDLHKTGDGIDAESPGQLGGVKEEVQSAACDLVCEWAQKVLKRQFDAVEDLARFLIDSHCIGNKSVAALTIMSGAATEVATPQSVSAFESLSFQPQVMPLSSPSVDAKQQLQRKIQRKQQEQKLHSPSPEGGQDKRLDDGAPCASPIPPSPQPTIGIVVAAVPSPVTVQRSQQLMSPCPTGPGDKVLPINFQMLTQPVQPPKQSPRTPQSLPAPPAGERAARQRYAQILPKPVTTTTIALCSPPAMIIANSPLQTVMTTCHVSPVSLVKMAAISLAPGGGAAPSSLTNTGMPPAPAGVGSCAVAEEFSSCQSTRGLSAVPGVAPPEQSGVHAIDVEMEVEAIHQNSQEQNVSASSGAGMWGGAGGHVQRAASVPIPQRKGLLGLEETGSAQNDGKPPSSSSSNNTSTLHSAPPSQNTRAAFSTSRAPAFVESSSGAKSLRKRSGLSPVPPPMKRLFIPQQPGECAAHLGYGNAPPGAPARPESAPATREVEMKMNLSTHVHTSSSFRASGFFTVSKTLKTNPCSVVQTSVAPPSVQQLQGSAASRLHAAAPHPAVQAQTNAAAGVQLQGYVQPLDFMGPTAASSQPPPPQAGLDYFPFDDDVTQDSIVEELVQMEEQMKLNNLQPFAAQQAAASDSMNPSSHGVTAFCHTTDPVHTPTPTSDVMGGAQGLTGESPCSHMASTTPVDSALGSSRHTPAGTPHSNCSSTVPPSPVECRNPFAFTPINSNITGFHEGSAVSSSPVKPMQRPTATHPDKTRLEWMSTSYSGGCGASGGLNKSSSGAGLLHSYRGLTDDRFQKPHAFAVPHARHHDSHFGRVTPASPVQQQGGSMNKQEGFAVPAPLDNKSTTTLPFRCRSVSPAVHQRNTPLQNVPQSPFAPPLTPDVFNILANDQGSVGVSSMSQRSRSVPVNVMMQTEVLPMSGRNLTNVLLSKLDGDHDATARGLGVNNLPPSYTARMNLTQILESKHLAASDSGGTFKPQRPHYLIGDAVEEQMTAGDSRVQSTLHTFNSQQQQQQQLDFSSACKDLGADPSLAAGHQLMEQVAELASAAAEFPCEIRMTSELSSSIADLNALDENLLFDPRKQQGPYHSDTSQDLAHQGLFQHLAGDAARPGGLDWLESKDHSTVGLMG